MTEPVAGPGLVSGTCVLAATAEETEARLLEVFREHDLIAVTYADDPIGAGFTIAVDADEQVLLRDGSTGPSAESVIGQVADRLGLAIDGRGDGYSWYDLAPRQGGPAPARDWSGELRPELIVCRTPTDALPALVAHTTCDLEAARVAGWTVVRLASPLAGSHGYGWGNRDLPVVTIHLDDGLRYVYLHADSDSSGDSTVLLQRYADRSSTVTRDAIAPELVPTLDILLDPHLNPGNLVVGIAELPGFSHVDVTRLLAALNAPEDDRWLGRVLAELGLPSLVAEVFEGRADLPDAVLFAAPTPARRGLRRLFGR